MHKALLVLAVVVASLAPVPGATPAGATRQQQYQRRDLVYWQRRFAAAPPTGDGRRWQWVRSRGPRRVAPDKLTFPADGAKDSPNTIGGEHPGDVIVFPNVKAPSAALGLPVSEKQKEEKGTSSNSGFGYGPTNGPDTWAQNYPTCGGDRQSPININLNTVKLPPPGVEDAPFFKYYDAPPLQLTVANSGHSIKLTGNWSKERRPRVSGFVLPGEYALAEIHFHWGADDEEGSEHLLQGDCYPLEMHAVHYKLAYGSIDEARKNNDGLAVVSYLFKVQGQRNPGLQKVIEAAKQVIDPASPGVSITPFTINKLAPPFTRNYASYLGSLTTPPCSEIVTWIVNLEPQFVSPDQLAKLRKLKTHDGTKMLFNFRPVQPLNGREIKFVP
ncbi:carbonic anhydrase-like isoform X2 [Ischnura elegans]|uniref:carbonic anhydrase-like isoform X2 n=1 Tax=Ischnura elegans TaxID=197161 RepID=UPI001ED8B767|nr:carbonic anhydrase-like isoform X2 [Ischnura elegans]